MQPESRAHGGLRRRLLILAVPATAFAAGLGTGVWWPRPVVRDSTVRSAPLPPVRESPARPALRDELVAALSVLNAAQRSEKLQALGAERAKADPAGAWSALSLVAGVSDREDYATGVLRVWAATDPGAALAAAAGLAPGRLRTACLSTALEEMARQDPDAALHYAQARLTGAAREAALTGIVRQWAATDAAAAARWSLQHLSEPGASGTLRAAVQTWTDSDPAAASQWVAGLPPGPVSSGALSALVETWAEQTPAEAAAWLASQGVGQPFDAPAISLAAQWASSDPKAAAEWAAALPRTSTARTAATRAIAEWAAVAPAEAANWLRGKAVELPALSSALHQSLGVGWAAMDPGAAVSWMDGLSDPWIRQETAPRLFNAWAATDAAGLESWVKANGAAPAADAAREQLALLHAESSPEAALGVAMQLSTPSSAAGLSRRIFQDWQSRDLTAASQWAAANPSAVNFLHTHP